MVHLCSYFINDKETYLCEVDKFAAWCQANILFLKNDCGLTETALELHSTYVWQYLCGESE